MRPESGDLLARCQRGLRRAEEAMRQAARAVVPVACPGCGLEDERWCEACAAPWWDAPFRCEEDASRLVVAGAAAMPVWSVAVLEGAEHGTIVAWKDGGRRDLDAALSGAMRRAARHVAPGLTHLPAPVTVISAPARRASTTRRGIDLPALLAEAAARGLDDAGVRSRTVRALTIGAGESRGSSAAARWRESRSAVRVTRTPPRSSAVMLVDDVVTTGATLAACDLALSGVGCSVVGALVLASARRVADSGSSGLR